MAKILYLASRPHGDICCVAQMAARPATHIPILSSSREGDPNKGKKKEGRQC